MIGLDKMRYDNAILIFFTYLFSRLVEDWDMFEKMVDYMYESGLKANADEHPILMSEPAWNSR